MCRPLDSIDVYKFGTVEEVYEALYIQLGKLAEIANDTNFNDSAHADQFSRNVTFLKGFYERAESLLHGND